MTVATPLKSWPANAKMSLVITSVIVTLWAGSAASSVGCNVMFARIWPACLTVMVRFDSPA